MTAPDLHMEVVGEGPLIGELQSQAASVAPGRVTFHGFIAGAARFDVVRRASALVMPSVSHDACPVAVLEAMALGVPVVASRQGGLPDLVADEVTGLLVPAGDAKTLAQALQRLSGSPDEVCRMGRAARERADAEFDVDVHYRRLLRAYEETIAER